MQRSYLLTYDYNPNPESGQVCEAFGLSEAFSGKWRGLIAEMRRDADKYHDSIPEFFLAKIDDGAITGAELMYFAVSGFLEPFNQSNDVLDAFLKALRGS